MEMTGWPPIRADKMLKAEAEEWATGYLKRVLIAEQAKAYSCQ